MRFCPFCAKENSDEGARCTHCGKRLPGIRRASVTVLLDSDAASFQAPVGSGADWSGADRSLRARRETVPTDSESPAPRALPEPPVAAASHWPLAPPLANGAIDEATFPGSSSAPWSTGSGEVGEELVAPKRHTATAPGRARVDDTAPNATDAPDPVRSATLPDPAIEEPQNSHLAQPSVHHTLLGVFAVDPVAHHEPAPSTVVAPASVTERHDDPPSLAQPFRLPPNRSPSLLPARSPMPSSARSLAPLSARSSDSAALRSPSEQPTDPRVEARPSARRAELPPLLPGPLSSEEEMTKPRPSARRGELPPLLPGLLSSDEEMATIRMPLFDAEELVRSSLARSADSTPLPAPSPASDLPQPLPPPPLELDRPWRGGEFLVVPEPADELKPLPPELSGLPVMPASPSESGPWGAVRYLFPVARAWWSRRGAQAAIRTALIGDQRALDQVLGELGRAAREEKLSVPAVRDEMLELAAVEERRAKAESETLAVNEKRIAELERFGRLASACDEAILAQEKAARQSAEELRAATDEVRSARSALGAIDAEIHSLERKLSSQQGRAAAAPPEQRGALEAEVLGTREQVAALGPRRDEAAGKLAEIEPPLAKVTEKADEDRAELSRRKRALAATTGERQEAIAALDARLKQLRSDGMTAAAEISRRHVTVGTLLNLNRVERDRFLPLYARIDELKGDVTEREALIARLEDERRAFDHGAVQQGLVVLAAGVGGMAILIVVLLFLRG